MIVTDDHCHPYSPTMRMAHKKPKPICCTHSKDNPVIYHPSVMISLPQYCNLRYYLLNHRSGRRLMTKVIHLQRYESDYFYQKPV